MTNASATPKAHGLPTLWATECDSLRKASYGREFIPAGFLGKCRADLRSLPRAIGTHICERPALSVVFAVPGRGHDTQTIGVNRSSAFGAKSETLRVGVELIERIVDCADQVLLVLHRGMFALFDQQLLEVVRLEGVHEVLR